MKRKWNSTSAKVDNKSDNLGEKVLVRNHPNKPRWISGTITTKVSDRTYTINIGQREIKRHIDHIARNHSNVSISQAEKDFSWDISYKPDTADQQPENVLPRPEERKTYPKRQRTATKRYGLNAD